MPCSQLSVLLQPTLSVDNHCPELQAPERHPVAPAPSVRKENRALRQGIKEYSDWPTIPQLYIKEEFIGGCDIVKEMFEKGELQAKLKEKKIPYQSK